MIQGTSRYICFCYGEGFHLNVNLVGLKILKTKLYIDLFAAKNTPWSGRHVLNFGRVFFKWLVVSTHLKNMCQNGNLPQVGVKIKDV